MATKVVVAGSRPAGLTKLRGGKADVVIVSRGGVSGGEGWSEISSPDRNLLNVISADLIKPLPVLGVRGRKLRVPTVSTPEPARVVLEKIRGR